ncbi:hypothetical protein EVAR_75064_1 [Eumeta japonica]|uniref:Uncharacterized protein n=1 Tax=Eumeta variegata TaxID=151549 RepID=A0A4C1W3B7_EUMVA|nr:hypothetical protein EVAR_75064_1 [Eumeta japonica]
MEKREKKTQECYPRPLSMKAAWTQVVEELSWKLLNHCVVFTTSYFLNTCRYCLCVDAIPRLTAPLTGRPTTDERLRNCTCSASSVDKLIDKCNVLICHDSGVTAAIAAGARVTGDVPVRMPITGQMAVTSSDGATSPFKRARPRGRGNDFFLWAGVFPLRTPVPSSSSGAPPRSSRDGTTSRTVYRTYQNYTFAERKKACDVLKV